MKKLIKRNPKKALKISLVIFLILMCINGLLVWLTGSVWLALLVPVLACVQISYVSKWSNYYINESIEENLIEQIKGTLSDIDCFNEVVKNEKTENQFEDKIS